MANREDQSVAERVRRIVGPLAQSLGLELVEAEYAREGPRFVLRVFIDRAGGVALDDCARLSHALGPLLEVEEVCDEGYALEVSSPGLERPLRKPEDFRRFAGQRAKVRTYAPLRIPPEASARKSFTGTLVGCDEGRVELLVGGARCQIPLEVIAKAHLVYDPSAVQR